jgi:hypothetical protein
MYNDIEIWQPRFHDRKVLIKPFNIKEGLNRVIFTKCDMPNLIISSRMIRNCPMEEHGSKGVYAVPLEMFSKEKTNQISMFNRRNV